MAQAVNFLESKVEIVLDVSHLNLAPCMAIMFLVHALHLPKVTVRTNNRGKFKQIIIIKFDRNAMNILNAKLVIIQIFQLGASMCGKRHYSETIYYTQHIGNVSNGILGISRNQNRMVHV
jgi:hypothetical protein